MARYLVPATKLWNLLKYPKQRKSKQFARSAVGQNFRINIYQQTKRGEGQKGKDPKGRGEISGRRGLRKQTHKILPSWSRHQTKTNYQGFGRIRGPLFLPHPTPFPTLAAAMRVQGLLWRRCQNCVSLWRTGIRTSCLPNDAFSLQCSFRRPSCDQQVGNNVVRSSEDLILCYSFSL